jgi:hypothetical protein
MRAGGLAMRNVRQLSSALEIDRLVSRHEQLSRAYRKRAKDIRIDNPGDLLQIAEFIEERGRSLVEHAHRFGPDERREMFALAEARLEAAEFHLSQIKPAKILQFMRKVAA